MKDTGTPRLLFVSTMSGSVWGGSEELWSQTALNLVSQSFACPQAWSNGRSRINVYAIWAEAVSMSGCAQPTIRFGRDHLRATRAGFGVRREIEKLLAKHPALVVFSDGGLLPPVALLELCVEQKMRFCYDWTRQRARLAKRCRN